MYTQMNTYFDAILSKYQFGFRKEYSAQKCLLIMIEKWSNSKKRKRIGYLHGAEMF